MRYLTTQPSTYDPLVVHDEGVLGWLHPNAFGTLLTLNLSINFDMCRPAETPGTRPWIRDPFFALASDGLLSQLTALQKLEIKVSIEANAGLDSFSWSASFGDQWSALDRALVASDGMLVLESLKSVLVRFSLCGDEYEIGMAKRLCGYVRSRMYQGRFQRLLARAAKGGFSFVYKFSVSSAVRKRWMDADSAVVATVGAGAS